MIFEMLVSYIASSSLAVIFNISKKELVFCGVAGVISEGIYLALSRLGVDSALAILAAASGVTAQARVFANVRRNPVTIYLLPGIIPLVPGAGMYNTVFNIIASQYTRALEVGAETLKTAAAVAVGIVLIFALPNTIFFKISHDK